MRNAKNSPLMNNNDVLKLVSRIKAFQHLISSNFKPPNVILITNITSALKWFALRRDGRVDA